MTVYVDPEGFLYDAIVGGDDEPPLEGERITETDVHPLDRED